MSDASAHRLDLRFLGLVGASFGLAWTLGMYPAISSGLRRWRRGIDGAESLSFLREDGLSLFVEMSVPFFALAILLGRQPTMARLFLAWLAMLVMHIAWNRTLLAVAFDFVPNLQFASDVQNLASTGLFTTLGLAALFVLLRLRRRLEVKRKSSP